MNLADMIVLAIVAVAVVFALRVHRKAGGCASGCSGCPHANRCNAGRK